MQLFVNNLTNVDFSYLHPTRGLVGETWLASIVLEGALDNNGMVCDFGIVKKTLRHWLDTHVDHCLLVPKNSKALVDLAHNNEEISFSWHHGTSHKIQLSSPKQAVTLIDNTQISESSVAQWCVKQLRSVFGDSVESISLTFECEKIDTPFYHYSHGLKKHDGNCQRIAHGHRSKIEIWRDGVLSHKDMQNVSKKWRDIYIGTREDIVEQTSDTIAFAYQSDQGAFALSLPATCVDIIDTDTTVEFIASHIAQTLKHENPASSFMVKAYEGLAKGAIVTV